MTDARIGRALLALCGHRAGEIEGLPAPEWRALDALAEQHRLTPFLHGRVQRGEIAAPPGDIAAGWQAAHRANAIAVLFQRRALLQAMESLASEGIGAVALKGSALAWTVWPAQADRAMRDIDLLVAEDNAALAYRTLRAARWEGPDLTESELAAFAERETHFPALLSPEGVVCELHARVWGRAPLPGMTMPERRDGQVLAHARHSEKVGMAIPGAHDMLAHLVVHAACSHLLNVGPLALVDIDLWCARKAIDWSSYWDSAQSDGTARPSALVFALVDRWRRPGFIEETHCPLAVDELVLDESELLLVQDLGARKDVSAIASLSAGKFGGRFVQHPLDRAKDRASFRQRLVHVADRATSLGRSLLSRTTRRDGIATARLQNWMES